MAYTEVFVAPAICDGPVSVVITAPAPVINPMRSGKSVFPTNEITLSGSGFKQSKYFSSLLRK